MTFEEIVDRMLDMLRRQGRVSYRAPKHQFDLDEAYIEDVKAEILYAHPQVVDKAIRQGGTVGTGPR